MIQDHSGESGASVDMTDDGDTTRRNPNVSAPPSKAVALHYEEGQDPAPRITATGRGVVAEQIVRLAFAHGVRVREDSDLVEILSHLEVDSVIPLEAFTAVAEILSYVYHANQTYGKPCVKEYGTNHANTIKDEIVRETQHDAE